MLTTTTSAVAFTDERLDNGLRLLVAPDHLTPAAAVNLSYGVGRRYERPGETELAHLFEHLMFEGSAHVAAGEHLRLVSEVGGKVNAGTQDDYTSYVSMVPSHHLELLFWLEAERLANMPAGLSEPMLDRQREVIWNEYRQRRQNLPYGTANDDIQERVFPPGHPYHTSAENRRELDRATLADVERFFRTWYAPNNAVLAVAGDVDPAVAREWAETYFGPVPANPAVPGPPDGVLAPRGGERRETIEGRVPLPRVYAAWPGPPEGTPEFDALVVGVVTAGMGEGSWLSRRLVGEQELAVDAGLEVLSLVGGASLVYGSATARPGVPVEAVEAAFHETVAGLVSGAAADRDLRRAAALLELRHLERLARLTERAALLATSALLFDDPDRVNRRVADLHAVTADQVQATAAAVFRADERVVLTYLPGGTP